MLTELHVMLPIGEVRVHPGDSSASNTKVDLEPLKQHAKAIVSNAADMYRPTNTVAFMLSAAVYTLFMTCSSAVSVAWPQRYADCSREKFGEESTCGRSLSSTSRSMTFDTVGRLDIGR